MENSNRDEDATEAFYYIAGPLALIFGACMLFGGKDIDSIEEPSSFRSRPSPTYSHGSRVSAEELGRDSKYNRRFSER